jgi:hypothetical protein
MHFAYPEELQADPEPAPSWRPFLVSGVVIVLGLAVVGWLVS